MRQNLETVNNRIKCLITQASTERPMTQLVLSSLCIHVEQLSNLKKNEGAVRIGIMKLHAHLNLCTRIK